MTQLPVTFDGTSIGLRDALLQAGAIAVAAVAFVAVVWALTWAIRREIEWRARRRQRREYIAAGLPLTLAERRGHLTPPPEPPRAA